MKTVLSASVLLIAAVAHAQERCDSPSPPIFCNTTEILAYESSDCRPFHIFLTRGSDEPYPGRLGNITREICAGIGSEDCGFENVQYPAKSTAWGVDEWCKSAAKGAANGQAQMKAYTEKCPDSKLMMLGFSQGAAVAQDILGGGGGQVFACDQATNPALDDSIGKNVIAAVTFGAVVRSRDQNFTVGDGKPFDGRRARTPEQLQALQKYSDVLLDYCHYGDPMCAVGSTPENVEVHLNYFVEHNDEVTKWMVNMAKAKGTASNGNAPTRPQSGSSSSIIAKPAATGSATPTTIASASATNDNGVQSAQTSSTGSASTGSASTGAASSLILTGGYTALLAGLGVALLQVFV